MNSRHCPHCNSNTVIRFGKTSSDKQRYKCRNCGKTWANKARPNILAGNIWHDFVFSNMTVDVLSTTYGLSKRKINDILKNYEVPPIVPPRGYECNVICTDVTYVGRRYGFLSVLDAHSGVCLYCSITRGYETVYDYEKALLELYKRNIYPKAVIIDGKLAAIKMFERYGLVVQMCQFHMIRIMTTYLTRKPMLEENRELRRIVSNITRSDKKHFEDRFYTWKLKNEFWLQEKHRNEDGKYEYSHQKTRSLTRGIVLLLPYLFTFEEHPELNISRTNNKLEGVHSALKSKLNIHRGAKKELKTKIVFSFLSRRTGV